ncbi:hypothetical protein, partial [Capnocytophaga ochracea]|uniref:hypothetical protein n=1 Tax=Capnocytophaga ochracea TaxID=1018 RepID=UPI002093E121
TIEAKVIISYCIGGINIYLFIFTGFFFDRLSIKGSFFYLPRPYECFGVGSFFRSFYTPSL